MRALLWLSFNIVLEVLATAIKQEKMMKDWKGKRKACFHLYMTFIEHISSVQLLGHVRLLVTPWTAARQVSLSITNSWSSPKPMSIELVMPSNHLILCRPLLLLPPIPLSIRVFSNESTLRVKWPKFGVSASTSVLPKNTQDWSPLGWTGWISLQSKGLSRVLSLLMLLRKL